MNKRLIKKVFIALLKLLPINKNKVVFCNFTGKGYGDNPKYIAEALHQMKPEIVIIWLCLDKGVEFPEYIKKVPMWTLQHYFHVATAKGIVSNVRTFLGVPKRAKQVYLQTWHGPFSPKLLEMDAEDRLTKEYVEQAKIDGKAIDGIISNSLLLSEQYKRSFWLGEQADILPFGLPRNDYLINNKENQELKQSLRRKIGVKELDYLVLYAPTFRDDYSVQGYALDFEAIIKAVEKRFNKSCTILIRLHPNVQKQSRTIKFNEKMINVTAYPDIQELSLISDAVISDYSSTVFDFSLLDKPVFICALDLDDYEKCRGLLKEFYDFPFPIAKTNEEMVANILAFSEVDYNNHVKDYFSLHPVYDDGHAANKAALWLLDRLNGIIRRGGE